LQPIHHRISTNKFDAARLLSEPEIREQVELATEAPSSLNIQHWRFVSVVKAEDNVRLSSNSKEAVTESAIYIMIKRWSLHILEHGTVPAVALALAIAPTNSRSWQRYDLTEPTKRGTEMLFSAPTTDTITLPAKDHEPIVASTKA
jgi:nitroreductase